MTEENLIKANQLKEKIASYKKYISLFKPIDTTIPVEMPGAPEGTIYVPIMPTVLPTVVSMVANYTPGVITTEGLTPGLWAISSASNVTDTDLIKVISDIASTELSSIGGTIIGSILTKITEMETEFNNL